MSVRQSVDTSGFPGTSPPAAYLRATQVSVLTSWFEADLGEEPPVDSLPPSMFVPLREGISALDLYFLSHSEMGWFHDLCKDKFPTDFSTPPKCPTEFVASLQWKHLRYIANKLKQLFHSPQAEPRQGIVTWRPRIVALATFFPRISSIKVPPGTPYTIPQKHSFGPNQTVAVKALRRSLHLAYLLGARVVEIVGGAGVPRAAADPARPEDGGEDYVGRAEDYHTAHLRSLAHALVEAYIPSEIPETSEFYDIPFADLPPVAAELEPGISFLLDSLPRYQSLMRHYHEVCHALHPDHAATLADKLTLNLDLAHAFMLGYKVEHLRDNGIRVGHVHASDHAAGAGRGGSHASDLVPGKFHTYEEYHPWLQHVVHELSRVEVSRELEPPIKPPLFSGYIGIELEACNQVESLHSALSTLRRWVQQVKRETPDTESEHPDSGHGFADCARGFILTVDIGNSTTAALYKSGLAGARELGKVVNQVMATVYEKGGDIISFGGDGFIAFFETGNFTPSLCQDEGARIVTEVLESICKSWQPASSDLHLRVALHFGDVWFISQGTVRNQALSQDIVTSVRLCDDIKRTHQAKQEAIHPPAPDSDPPSRACTVVAATDQAYQQLDAIVKKRFTQEDSPVVLRDGTNTSRAIWIHQDCTTTPRRP